MDLDVFISQLIDYLRDKVIIDARVFNRENRFLSSLWKGKFLRTKFIATAFYSLRRQIGRKWKRIALKASAGIEIIHLASLLHDDVIDKSDERRGKPCFYKRFSPSSAIVWGDWLFAAGVREFDEIGAASVGIDAILNICEGQLLEEKFNSFRDIDWDNYYEIISKKTASLFSIGLDVLDLVCEDKGNVLPLKDYAFLWGIAFQLYDDLIDIEQDIHDKKITFPFILLKEMNKTVAKRVWGGEGIDKDTKTRVVFAGKEIIRNILAQTPCPDAFADFHNWMMERVDKLKPTNH